MPRNGYYEVSGYLELRRRRGGGNSSGTVDIQTSASLDDGRWVEDASFSAVAADTSVGNWPGAPGPDTFNGFSRFLNVVIPQGVTIDVAYIEVNNKDTTIDGAGTKANIYFEDSDDAVAPTSTAEGNALTRTTAFTAWDDIDFTNDIFTQSPSIVDVVKEVVDRGSWVSGNAMMVIVDDDGSTGGKLYQWHSYDGDTAKAIKLHVEWST